MQEQTRNGGDRDRVEEHRSLSSGQVFEVVRRDGVEELSRPSISLAWSGLAAGLAIGFSVVAEAVIASHLPDDAVWAPLIENMGYTVGFILVVIGRLQLFTENTITPVLPICRDPSRRNLLALARLWSVVLLANMVGAVLFALFVMHTSAVTAAVKTGVVNLGRHAVDGPFLDTMTQGVGAGFLIAALVWLLANSRNGQLVTVFVITYVIALSGFAHVVAGAVEMAALVSIGLITTGEAVFGFILPALLGNVLGGTVLFTLIAYGQIRHEIRE